MGRVFSSTATTRLAKTLTLTLTVTLTLAVVVDKCINLVVAVEELYLNLWGQRGNSKKKIHSNVMGMEKNSQGWVGTGRFILLYHSPIYATLNVEYYLCCQVFVWNL